jgi:hypothetical protein
MKVSASPIRLEEFKEWLWLYGITGGIEIDICPVWLRSNGAD